MKTVKLISALVLICVLTFLGCKKDEGLTESQKDSFIKYYGVNAEGSDFAITNDGGFILVGSENIGGEPNVTLIKLDAYGNTSWKRNFRLSISYAKKDSTIGIIKSVKNVANDIEIFENNGFAIYGTTTLNLDSGLIVKELNNGFLILTDATGNLKTNDIKYFGDADGKLDEQGNGLVIASDGDLITVGDRSNSADGTSVGIWRRISGSTFQTTYKKETEKNLGTNFISLSDVIETEDGNFAFVGSSDKVEGNITGISAGLFRAVDLSQTNLLNSVYGGNGEDKAFDLVENDQGYFVAVGFKTIGGNRSMYAFECELRDINALPAIWETELGQSSISSTGYRLTSVSDGYLVAGVSDISGKSNQMTLVKIGTDGSLIWSKDFGYVNFDEAKAVTQTVDGNIAIFGTASDERGNKSMCLIKMNSNGELIQ